MRLLTKDEYHQTMSMPMNRVGLDDAPPFDFWRYFEAIPESDFQGFDCSEGDVDNAWNDPTGRYQHVLINSRKSNVFMVLVLDLGANKVHGHILLDLNREYGQSN